MLRAESDAELTLLHVADDAETGEAFLREWVADHGLGDATLRVESGDIETAIEAAATDATMVISAQPSADCSAGSPPGRWCPTWSRKSSVPYCSPNEPASARCSSACSDGDRRELGDRTRSLAAVPAFSQVASLATIASRSHRSVIRDRLAVDDGGPFGDVALVREGFERHLDDRLEALARGAPLDRLEQRVEQFERLRLARGRIAEEIGDTVRPRRARYEYFLDAREYVV